MNLRNLVFVLIPACFFSCTGPRNIYSASPFVSPVRMDKGNIALEANYFTHTRQTNRDTIPGIHDNCIGLNISHMLTERSLVFGFIDIKKEQDMFRDSIAQPGDSYFYQYNAGFDSSVIFVKRHTIGAGVQFFSKDYNGSSISLAISLGWHHFSMNESGLLQRVPYHRFYKVNQLSLSLQQNFLIKISRNFKLGWVPRLTVLNNFKAHTDYSFEEKVNASLLDNRIYALFSMIGFYADYRPSRKIPLHIVGQFFNEWSLYGDKDNSDMVSKTNPFHVKGTGAAAGVRYIFK